MRNWRGIASDVVAISDGAQMVRNLSFYTAGEIRRRSTLEIAKSTSGPLGMVTYGAPNGTQYVLFITSTGTVSIVSAS